MSVLEQVCPILPSRNFDATDAFYGALGFTTQLRIEDEYLIVNRDRVEIHFFHAPQHVAAESDHGAYIRPSDVDAFSRAAERLDLPRAGAFPKFVPAQDKPWGMREAVVWDPDGNLLRVGVEIADG